MRARKVSGLDPGAALRPNAALIVRTRLEELRSHAETALEPSASTAQHDTRIAAKRLRYVLEITEPCFGSEAAVACRTARDLQGVLGDLHDCDVLLPRVDGVESLETLLRARRELLFQRFREVWRTASENGTWTALERSL
ncbi:MAG: CHAD domain-containing protein [Solirubrobacterales bacterium]